MSDLPSLLSRVRAATGPDRELFLEICDSLLSEFWASENRQLHTLIEAAAWTDAALTLTEKLLPGQEEKILRRAWAVLDQWPGLSFREKLPLCCIWSLLSALIANQSESVV